MNFDVLYVPKASIDWDLDVKYFKLFEWLKEAELLFM